MPDWLKRLYVSTVSVAELSTLGAAPKRLSVLGRPSSTRTDWEDARVADAADLNKFSFVDEIESYVVPIWSNEDIDRVLKEMRGFDDVQVFIELKTGAGFQEALASIAESEWAGAAFREGDVAEFLHTCASLDIPHRVVHVEPERAFAAVALSIAEDLPVTEISNVLESGTVELTVDSIAYGAYRANQEAIDHALDLLQGIELSAGSGAEPQ